MKPYNRRLMIEVVEEEKDKDGPILLVPDDYKEEERYTLCKVLDTSDDISFLWPFALIESHLIENIEVRGTKHHFAPVSAVVMVGDG
jgi:hypothetical protein